MRSNYEQNHDGVTFWPKAVKFLLRTYETSGEIREAIIKLKDTRPNDIDDKNKYVTQLSKVPERCGIVHS